MCFANVLSKLRVYAAIAFILLFMHIATQARQYMESKILLFCFYAKIDGFFETDNIFCFVCTSIKNYFPKITAHAATNDGV